MTFSSPAAAVPSTLQRIRACCVRGEKYEFSVSSVSVGFINTTAAPDAWYSFTCLRIVSAYFFAPSVKSNFAG